MISQRVKDYIAEQSFCSEYLFKDWEGFLKLLYEEGGRISMIVWWDYCTLEEHYFSVGMGGYHDPTNSEYIYAETQFFDAELETKTYKEILEYITNVRASGFRYDDKHISHELVPSFYFE